MQSSRSTQPQLPLPTLLRVCGIGSGSGSDLVPGVGPVRGADEHGQDLGSGQQGGSPLGNQLCVEVVGTLLEHEVRADVGGEGEEVHVPEEER